VRIYPPALGASWGLQVQDLVTPSGLAATHLYMFCEGWSRSDLEIVGKLCTRAKIKVPTYSVYSGSSVPAWSLVKRVCSDGKVNQRWHHAGC
jgi:hypothetical protein